MKSRLRNIPAWVLSLGAAAVALAACDHRVESPGPVHVLSATPQVICTEQLTTDVQLTGDHFVPAPVRTLGGMDGGNQPQTLQLPSVLIARSASLYAAGGGDGGTAGDASAGAGDAGTSAGDGGTTSVVIPDDYNAPSDMMRSRVHWASETSMSFQIFPELALTPGVYGITVTNPDGVQAGSLTNALALVPPPHIGQLLPPALCLAQSDQTLTIQGANYLQIGTMKPTVTITPSNGGAPMTYTPSALEGCADVAGSVLPNLQECTRLTLEIPRNTLQPGTYTVTVTNPVTANCASPETTTLTVNPPPAISDVTPRTLCQGGGTLTVSGSAFQSGAQVALGNDPASRVVVMGTSTLQATFSGSGGALEPNMVYDVTVTNPDGCQASLPRAVTVTAGPVVFFADPPVVYNGITTQVTLYATSVRGPLMSVTMQLPGGTPITLQAIIDPAHLNRILATIPLNTPAGMYDITVTDATGCPATLSAALRVVSEATIDLTGIDPPFGWRDAANAVTITAAGGLMPTPRAYLNPHNAGATTIATALSSVSFQSATRLTAIVPAGLDPGANPYDLIVVNPDGTVGVLTMPDAALYRSQINPPPLIDSVSPGAVPNTNPPAVTITGQNFRTPTVTFTCVTDVVTGTRMTFPATASGVTSTSITIASPPVTTVPAPSLCTIRVTDDDGSYGDFEALAISNSSGNLSLARSGPTLPEPRRAPAVLGVNATRSAHFLYAAGGDNGAAAGALDSVAFIDTNENGPGTAWSIQRYHLNAPRTLAGYASLGRYLYVVGGNNAAGPVGTVERAMVLDPLQAPTVADVDVIPGAGTGLGGGIWYYRVAAVMAANDADNPGGETLPSDEVPIQLPDLAQKLQVKLVWTAVPGAAGYVVYRTPTAGLIGGQEEMLAMVTGGTTLTYTDTGTATTASAPKPLPLGSTGAWRALATLGTPRESNAAVFGQDPAAPNTVYLYATLGRNTAALGSYEFLTITVDPTTGRQTPAAAWTPGALSSALPRAQHGAYSATAQNSSFVPAGTDYIYLGGGTADGNTVAGALESALVTAGGQLGAFTPTGATIREFGYGAAIAANYVYTFGDQMPSTAIRAGEIVMGAAPAIGNVNNNGSGLVSPRYLPGTALQGAYIFVVGGSSAGRTGAADTTEFMVW